MNQLYNLDGTQNTKYVPYIFASETTFSTNLFDPSRSVLYGMYTEPVPPASVMNPVDVYYYEQRLRPRWSLREKPTFPMVMADQSMIYQKYASSAVSSRGGSSDGGSRHMYRRLNYT